MDKIFGYTEEEIRRQLGTRKGHDVDPQYKDKPIRLGETFEPCIRGSQKILDDPEMKAMMKKILRGTPKK